MVLQLILCMSFESLSQELNNQLESIRGKLDILLSTGDQRRRSSITEIQHRIASISHQVRSTRVVNRENELDLLLSESTTTGHDSADHCH